MHQISQTRSIPFSRRLGIGSTLSLHLPLSTDLPCDVEVHLGYRPLYSTGETGRNDHAFPLHRVAGRRLDMLDFLKPVDAHVVSSSGQVAHLQQALMAFNARGTPYMPLWQQQQPQQAALPEDHLSASRHCSMTVRVAMESIANHLAAGPDELVVAAWRSLIKSHPAESYFLGQTHQGHFISIALPSNGGR